MMSRKKKVFIIIHLIFAFTFLSWLLIKPYAMDVVSRKSQAALYEMVIERQALFDQLPLDEQQFIKQGFEKKSIQPHRVFANTSVFSLAWIFFSIMICTLLLFHIEGAAATIWILPLLTIGYGYELYSTPSRSSENLFPKENYVREHYVIEQKGLSDREQLLKAWHLYLIHEWAHESPSEELKVFDQQLEKALFAFNIARLKWVWDGKGDEIILAGFAANPSLFRIISYFVWNILLAWFINRKTHPLSSALLSNPN